MSEGQDFLKDISDLLRDTETLLMDMDAQAPSGVVVLDDSVVALDSSQDEPSSPPPPPSRTVRGTTTNRRRGNSNTSSTAGSLARQNRATNPPMPASVIDLCTPMAPPRTGSTSPRRARAPTAATRRRVASNRAGSLEVTDTINLDDTDVDLDLDEPGPSAPKRRSLEKAAAAVPQKQNESLDMSTDSSGPHCPICLCKWTAPVSTLCGHIFCKACIGQWIKVTKSCPVCKAGAAKLKTHPIFIS